MEWLTQATWSPYVAGAGIGILSWLAFLLSDKGIGCSTAFARTAGMIEAARSEGVDAFGAPVWRNWEMWHWLEGSPPDVILISNGADAVHYHTGLPVRLAPRKWMHSAGRTPTSELEDFAEIFGEGRPVFYVWIMDFPRTGARVNYYSPEEILERYRLEPIAAFPEGAVFMILPRPSTD